MRRSEALEAMIQIYNTTPDKATSYHKMDMLLSRLERIGMMPPKLNADSRQEVYFDLYEWEPENEEES